jgi:endonuclease/exonuclease/phosphatase (EEP) superfamily protein YafD
LGGDSLPWDVLAHFAPVWFLACAAALAGSFLLQRWRRWSVAALSLPGLAAALVLVAPEYLRSAGPKAAADAPGQIKLVQFNVWEENADPEAVVKWLDAERPDFVVVEENSDAFQAVLARHREWSVSCMTCEVVILSRTPALSVAHGRRREGARIPLTAAVFQDARGPLEIIGVHQVWPSDPEQQIEEEALAAMIAQTPRERLIVAGDFNSAPWSFARRRWDAAFGLPRRDRALYSWPARLSASLPWLRAPLLPIDHVYAGPGWATVSVTRGPRLSSDHYPVVVTLAPVGPAPSAPR